MKKFEHFKSNLKVLVTAENEDLSNEFIIGGIIDKFFVQFELGWKVLKELLSYEGQAISATGSPKMILKTAFTIFDFMDEDIWLGMLKNRNDLTHIYDELAAKRLVGVILKDYIPEFVKMQKGIEEYYGMELENMKKFPGGERIIRIAMADDDEVFLKKIEKYVEKYQGEHGEEIETTLFSDAKELIEGYTPRFDIIILDIEMPGLNGMEAAEQIRQVDENVVLMFITNMIQYAIRGYSVGALDFVMKPVNYYTFSLKLTRAIGRIQKKDKEILLKLQDSVKKVPVDTIRYVEIQNRMLYYYTSRGEYVVRGTIKSALDMLAPYHFVKCNHWYIVNLKYVTEVRDNTAIVAGKELEISQRKKNTFLNALMDYVGEGNQR